VTRLLRRVVASRLHLLLGVVVCAVRAGRHHASHARDSVARLSVSVHGRWWLVELSRVDVESHAVLLVGHHVWLCSDGWGSGDGRSSYRHDVARLLCAGNEHGNHASRRHVLGWRSGGRIVVVLRDESLGLESRLLERLKCGRVNGSFGDVGEWSTRRHLTRVGGLANMLVEGLLLDCGSGAVNVRGNLLVEGLLFLLLGRVERHGGGGLDASNRHGLLWAWLVHGELALPVFAISWLLGKRVGVRAGHHVSWRNERGWSIGHPGPTWWESYYWARRIEGAVARHDRPGRRDKVVATHLASNGRSPTHGYAWRVDAPTVRTSSSAREATTSSERAETAAASAKALLVRSQRTWDEYEGALDRGEDVARGRWRQ
jgi:hypothetical protein